MRPFLQGSHRAALWCRFFLFLLALVPIIALHAQSGTALDCSALAGLTPSMRFDHVTEVAGDLVILCHGGTPAPAGALLPQTNIVVTLPAPATSRLYGGQWSEALLLVDEPGSGDFPGAPVKQRLCADPAGICNIYGTGTGVGVYDGTAERPNVFQGKVSGNTITFSNIPFDAPAGTGWRVLHITNMRINAAAVAAGSAAVSVYATVSTSGGVSLPITSSPGLLMVGIVQSALVTSVLTPDGSSPSGGQGVSQCVSGPQRIATLSFAESASAFRTRSMTPFFDANTSPAPQPFNNPAFWNFSESHFYAPALTGPNADFATVGLADTGTRIRAVFSNIPAGTGLYVSAVPVTFTGGTPTPVTADAVARLISDETQPFAPAAVTATLEGIPVTQLPVVDGTASAVWEVLAARVGVDTMKFAVWVQAGGSSEGFATVTQSFSPISDAPSASATAPIPRFVAGPGVYPVNLFSTNACSPTFTTGSALPGGLVGAAYNTSLNAIGGVAPYSFAVTGGALPAGVALSAGGALSGTPKAAGDFRFTVTVSDRAGASDMRAFTLHIDTPPCSYSLTPASNTLDIYAHAGLTFTVNASESTCPWSLSATPAWLHAAPTSGMGSGTVTYSVDRNGMHAPRIANISVAGLTFQVTQAGAYSPGCLFYLDSVSGGFPDAGGKGQIHVTMNDMGCTWVVATDSSWLTITELTGFIASGDVLYSVAPNTTGVTRTGHLTVAGQTVTITQVAGCSFTLSAPTASVTWLGGSGTVSLIASNPSCPWTSYSTQIWAQRYPQAGTGSATIQYSVNPSANTGGRSATIYLGGLSFTTTQTYHMSAPEDERFVNLMYFGFLGRLPSATELGAQLGSLQSGAISRTDLAVNLFNTDEFNNAGRFATGLYVGILGRDAEYSGWVFQRAAYLNGQATQEQLVSNFLGSAEYALKYGTPADDQYVLLLYANVLRRTPAPAEKAAQLALLASGTTRTQLALDFLNGAEFRANSGPTLTAFLQYACMLVRDAEQWERDYWSTLMSTTMTVPQVFGYFANSDEMKILLQ